MKTIKTFKNASLVSVMDGSVIVKSAAGIEHTFTNASVVSVNNGTIIIESEWTPKKGELVKIFTKDNGIRYAIFKEIETYHFWMYCASFSKLTCLPCDYIMLKWYNMDEIVNIFPVTSEEQKEFDDYCKSTGKIWNKEKLQWEKYRWKPLMGEWYYYINHANPDIVGRHCWANDLIDNRYYNNYNYFQTREKALEAAKEVKKLLKSL